MEDLVCLKKLQSTTVCGWVVVGLVGVGGVWGGLCMTVWQHGNLFDILIPHTASLKVKNKHRHGCSEITSSANVI